MNSQRLILGFLLFTVSVSTFAQTFPPADWGAPQVAVSHKNGFWLIDGQKQVVSLDEKSLQLEADAQVTSWRMVPASTNDMIVEYRGKEFPLALTDAKKIVIEPYDTGFKTGVKLTLSDFRHGSDKLDLTLYLEITLQGDAEDLVFDIAATEGDAVLRQLQWPTALDSTGVDYVVLSNNKGDLLPNNWPKAYYPIQSADSNGVVKATDHSVLQSHVIEDWGMSFWGFERGKSAMMVIVETPDDAAYQFSHPAGGPTVIGPRWRDSLGKFRYMRTARMVFLPEGNYVTMAKRYRQYVMDTGLFVSLKEKIAKKPILADVIGEPETRVRILFNQTTNSDNYNLTNHYELHTFAERAEQLRAMKSNGIDHAIVYCSGWAHLGYDRQHPDALPPPEAAGGWDGMKQLFDTAHELGYQFIFHDQYRDYYLDAPSHNFDSAVHEEDNSLPARQFPGSRFGDYKQGSIPFMLHWDGGPQNYLNSRYQLGHLEKNYQLFFAHGIHPDGIYIDVIGYVPPDEDFNPEHPTTRTDAMLGQANLMNWASHNLGVTSTEAGSDWVIPFSDIVNQSGGVGKHIAIPLYQLVYHDAVLVTFGEARTGGEKNYLLGILYGGVPELPVDIQNVKTNSLELIKEMAALSKRTATSEMVNHEFLSDDRKKERTTFADGTTVTVDWNSNTVDIEPKLTDAELAATGMK